jgi:hypothetical protein
LLHEIAGYAVLYGAFYVNTDGYIFKKSGKWDRFIAMLKYYNLMYKADIAMGEVNAWNSYRLDKVKTTVPYQPGKRQPQKLSNLVGVGSKSLDWWKKYCQIRWEELYSDKHSGQVS